MKKKQKKMCINPIGYSKEMGDDLNTWLGITLLIAIIVIGYLTFTT